MSGWLEKVGCWFMGNDPGLLFVIEMEDPGTAGGWRPVGRGFRDEGAAHFHADDHRRNTGAEYRVAKYAYIGDSEPPGDP